MVVVVVVVEVAVAVTVEVVVEVVVHSHVRESYRFDRAEDEVMARAYKVPSNSRKYVTSGSRYKTGTESLLLAAAHRHISADHQAQLSRRHHPFGQPPPTRHGKVCKLVLSTCQW